MIRFQGYVTDDGFYVLDTATGAVKLVRPDGATEVCAEWGAALALPVQPQAVVAPVSAAAASPAPPQPSLDPLDMMVLSSFPYPIATTYQSFINEPDPRLRCKLLVDTFTNVIKMWALQIASEYLIAEDVKDTAVNQTLSRDFQRPLISAWNLMLHRCIPVLQEAEVAFFSPELPRCYERLESRCKDRFSVKKRYEDKEGNSKFKISKLGKIQAMIKYRNSLAHGYNQSTQQAEKELSTYVPLLREILDAAKFMTRTPLCMLKKQGPKYEIVRLMGLSPAPDAMEIPDLDLDPDTSPVFLYDPTQQRVLPLFSFFDIEQTEGDGMGLNQDVFLFEGRTKKSVIYLSTQGEHLEKQSKYQYWVELLSKKALEVKLINPDKLDLDMLQAACDRINARTLAKLSKSGRYVPEICQFRSDFHSTMQQFVAGNFRTFLLTGDSGVGKTNYLAQLVERSQNITLFYSASEFRNTDLGSKLLRDMGFRSMYLEDFLANSTEHFLKADRKFFLVIDALNTFSGSLTEFLTAINQLTEQVEDYPWFRIVVSIRRAPYERCTTKLQARFPQGLFTVEDPLNPGTRTPEIRMLDLSSELLSECYEGYRSYRYVDPEDEEDPGVYVYRPRTAFAELDAKGSTIELLRQPLMLRLVMSAFHRRVLPSTLTDDEIMPSFLDQIVVEAQAPGGGYPNRKRFLVALARQLFAMERESARVEELYEVPLLEKELRNRQPDSAYVQLIEMGLLQESWQEDEAFVSFSMDELLSYLLAQILEAKIGSAADVLSWSQKALHFTPIIDALRVIIQRAIRDGREHLFFDLLDLVEVTNGVLNEESVLIVQQCERVLYSLCINKDPAISGLLKQLEQSPSWGDFLLLQSLVERCLVSGVVDNLDPVLDTADAESEVLGVEAQLMMLRLRLKCCLHLGRPKAATEIFNRRQYLGEGRNDALWAEVLYLAMRVNKEVSAIDVSTALYNQLVKFESLSVELKVDMMWVMGVIHFEQDRPDEAEQLLTEALSIADQHNLNEARLQLLNALARVQIAAAKVEEGISSLEEVVRMAQSLGAKRSELSAENSLAVTRRSVGQVEEATAGLFRSLSIADELGRKISQAVAHTNIGVLLWMSGDERALSHQQRSHQIFVEASFLRGLGYCIYRMLIMANGDQEAVASLSSELAELSKSLTYSKQPIWLAGARLMSAIEKGQIESIINETVALNAARAEVSLANIHLEDGPVFPWVYAAQSLERAGRTADISPILTMIDAELDGRYFHMQDELERLRELTL